MAAEKHAEMDLPCLQKAWNSGDVILPGGNAGRKTSGDGAPVLAQSSEFRSCDSSWRKCRPESKRRWNSRACRKKIRVRNSGSATVRAAPHTRSLLYLSDPVPARTKVGVSTNEVPGKMQRVRRVGVEEGQISNIAFNFIQKILSIVQWAGHELLPKCGDTFTKCVLCKVPLA
jgi:hypothetical protein